MPRKTPCDVGQVRRSHRTCFSAAAFAGCIGLPDTDGRLMLGDGGLEAFLPVFNRAADRFFADRESRGLLCPEVARERRAI